MSKFLNRAIGEVIGAARANPDAAPQIFGEAARQFRIMAADPRNVKDAPALADAAEQFSRATGGARFGTDFEVLLRDHHKAYMATPDPTTNDLEVYGRQGVIAEEGGDAGDDEDDEEDTGPTAIGAKSPSVSSDTGMMSMHIKASPPSVTKLTPIGRNATVKYNPTQEDIRNGITQTQTVILWQGDKFEAQSCTVDIGVVQDGPGAAPDPFAPDAPAVILQARPYAIVEYGSDGFRTVVKVDVGHGARMTLVGNYVSVLVGMSAPDVGYEAPAMTIGASLGFFAATSVAPVTYTAITPELESGTPRAVAYIKRPARAQRLIGIFASTAGASAEISFTDTTGTVGVGAFSWATANTLTEAPVVLPNDCAYIILTNTTGDLETFRLVFELAL